MYRSIYKRREWSLEGCHDETIEKCDTRPESYKRLHTGNTRLHEAKECYEIGSPYDEENIGRHNRKEMMPHLIEPERHLSEKSPLFSSDIENHIEKTQSHEWHDDADISSHRIQFCEFLFFECFSLIFAGRPRFSRR